MISLQDVKEALGNAPPDAITNLGQKDREMYERLKTKLKTEICIYPPKMIAKYYHTKKRGRVYWECPDKRRRVGSSLVVYLDRMVINEWR